MAKASRTFVKAKDTTVSPEKSRAEVEALLRRYGAIGFGVSVNYETGDVSVDFVVPDTQAADAPRIPVRIPVQIRDVFVALYPGSAESHDVAYVRQTWPHAWARAERVAWRNLVLWIDAALSAAAIGIRTIATTFAADRLVSDDTGRVMRVEELLARGNGALPGGSRLLLLPGGGST